jgi:hypothetical protein
MLTLTAQNLLEDWPKPIYFFRLASYFDGGWRRRLAAPYRKALADCMQCRFIAIRQYCQQRGLALSYCRLIGTDLSCNFLISRPSDFLSDVFGREDIQAVRYIEMLRVV